MILYNITAIVDSELHSAWLQRVQEQFIPEVMATDIFVSNRTLKVRDSPNEGVTYCVQFVAETIENYNLFISSNYEQKVLEFLKKDFEPKLVLFTSIMEYID